MGTHCTIGYEREDGTIVASYCHYDGYVSSVGVKLARQYSDIEKIKELIALGAMSYLTNKINPSVGSNHSFVKPEDGVTVFYHRDRGEPWKQTAPTEYYSFDDWFDTDQEEYNYLYMDGAWHCLRNQSMHQLSGAVLAEEV